MTARLRPAVSERNRPIERHEAMNRFEKLIGMRTEARLRYLDGEYQVLSPGDFVRCGVTGEMVPLPELRYWSVDLQEAYASADASLRRTLERRTRT